MSEAAADDAPSPASALGRAALAVAAAASFAALVALGNWQLERRAWKHALVERVEQRVRAEAVAAPPRADWPLVSAARDEYRRVRVAGAFVHDRETLVQAATRLGAGWWVLTPLRGADGTTVLVNRGFVPPERRSRATRGAAEPRGETVVTGLLRLSEPGGAFLRRNDPAADRWHSRDVAAIARARGLDAAAVAPYFVDAEGVPGNESDDTAPVGGLTVIAFADNHLGYALTWYALAAMVAAAAGYAAFGGRRAPRAAAPGKV